MTSQTLLAGSVSLLDEYVRPRDADAKGLMFDYDVSLKRTFTPRTHELTSEFRFNRAHDEDLNAQRRLSPGSGYVDGRREENDAVSRQFTGQVDYLRTLRPRTKLETG